MARLIIALAMAVVAAGPAVASQETDVMAPIQQFVEGFDKSDVKKAQAACVDQTFVIDDFPPHEWHGAGATAKWLSDYDAYAKKNGITDGIVTLGKPSHIDVTDVHAYVVIPVKLALKKNGKVINQPGVMTLALRKDANGWRIAAWAWADG